jgi:trans-aconitate methyltransferase
MEFWDGIYAGLDHWRATPYVFVTGLRELFADKSVLDVGCGLGDGLEVVEGHCPTARLAGVDFYAPALAKAAEKLPDAVFTVLDMDACLPDDVPGADTIMIVQTLEHVKYPYEVLAKCLRKCTRLVLTVPPPHNEDKSHLWAFDQHDFDVFHPFISRGSGPNMLYVFGGLRLIGRSSRGSRRG